MLLSDEQIGSLIAETKPFPKGLLNVDLTKVPAHNQHRRKDFAVECSSGNKFIVALRQSTLNALDFSVILGYHLPHLYRVFRLRRYNGKSHHHTNTLERVTIYRFHIHEATERYQQNVGFKEDHYATLTPRYADLNGAIECMLEDCGFTRPLEVGPLFTGIAE